jgi:hypothetical protein
MYDGDYATNRWGDKQPHIMGQFYKCVDKRYNNKGLKYVLSKFNITLCHFFHSCTMHLDTIESFIYPTDAQLDLSKNVKIYIKIYMKGAPTCFGSSQPSSGSYYVCFAKDTSINNQLIYVVYSISLV